MNKQVQERVLRKTESISRKMEKYKPIYDAYMSGATLRKIGAEYGISHETVRQIVNAEKRRVERDMNNVEYTSDWVSVVRCRDCKYSDTFADTTTATTPLKCLNIRYGGVFPDWYCEHGERRDSE